MSSSTRRARSELTEIDSRMFGLEDVTFLTPNNTALLAHQGSTVTLSCRLTKTPNFGMVRIRNDFETLAKKLNSISKNPSSSGFSVLAIFNFI